jgi:AraC-like DNA-binding protein/mannose-6-phosphate isomerase-like protein (cupin superfamily)
MQTRVIAYCSGVVGLDSSRIVKVGSGFGTRVEVLRASYETHSFARHSHDTYTLGLVTGGAGTFWCRGAERFACKGDIVVIPPGEVHTGSVSAGAEPLSYLALYVPVELATLHAIDAGGDGGTPPEFSALVLRDSRARRAFQSLDRAIASSDAFGNGRTADAESSRRIDKCGAEEAACRAITELIRGHADDRVSSERSAQRAIRAESRIVGLVRAILEDSFADSRETSLATLARRTGVTPFRVIRAFRGATGLAPHQYLVQVRVERARQFLADGAGPSFVAAMTGFVDQSHLTYHFKKHLGITPGNYRRCMSSSAV